FTNPNILLLDEHTAALDPTRAKLITDLTKKVVEESGLTTLMVTHNMQQALDLGTRLIMMDKGEIMLDIDGEEKQGLTLEELMDASQERQGTAFRSDRAVLGYMVSIGMGTMDVQRAAAETPQHNSIGLQWHTTVDRWKWGTLHSDIAFLVLACPEPQSTHSYMK